MFVLNYEFVCKMTKLENLGAMNRNQNHSAEMLHDFSGRQFAFSSCIYWNTDDDSGERSHRSTHCS